MYVRVIMEKKDQFQMEFVLRSGTHKKCIKMIAQ